MGKKLSSKLSGTLMNYFFPYYFFPRVYGDSFLNFWPYY